MPRRDYGIRETMREVSASTFRDCIKQLKKMKEVF